jgi:hypothetical protein
VRRVQRPTREWDSNVSLEGVRIVVKGAQIPGGKIAVVDSTSNREVIAADPGDYIIRVTYVSTLAMALSTPKLTGFREG